MQASFACVVNTYERSAWANCLEKKLTSAMETRLRSPPLTPRTKSPPTLVLKVCFKPNRVIRTSRIVSTISLRETPGGRA